MKSKLFLFLLCLCGTVQLSAQSMVSKNPLTGTWQVVSIKGTGSDGTKIMADGSQFNETKIITPSHYILITLRKQGDSLVFDKAIAGTVRVQGNKYIETPMYASNNEIISEKTDFTYKLAGDRFIQAGTITSPDGKSSTLDELIFKKVKEDGSVKNPAVGTWNQLSSRGTDETGKQLWAHTNATHIRFTIISPTHWMVIRTQNNKFENAVGGTYRLEGNKMHPNLEMDPSFKGTVEITQRVEGNKLYWSGYLKEQKIRFEDVFERVADNPVASR